MPIPRRTEAVHVNLPDFFYDAVADPYLRQIRAGMQGTLPVVLNFEKARWFDLLALTRLLSVLLFHSPSKPPIHILGPCSQALPFLHVYLRGLAERRRQTDSIEERRSLTEKLKRHEETLPRARTEAGAFLTAWGFFDAVEDYYAECHWYVVRDKEVSLRTLKDTYGFAYAGRGIVDIATETMRITPFTVVTRDQKDDTVSHLNSEDLAVGPLQQFSTLDLFRTGALSNIIFFEPLENIFQHAFEKPTSRDAGVYTMRLRSHRAKIDPPEPFRDTLSRYLAERNHYAFIEVVLADGGRGIPATLAAAFSADTAYAAARAIDRNTVGDAELIRYAFEAHSTRKHPRPLGDRGLAWLRRVVLDHDGYVRVVSRNGSYEFYRRAGDGTEVEQLLQRGDDVAGTAVQVLLPLARNVETTRRLPDLFETEIQRELFVRETPSVAVVSVPDDVITSEKASTWRAFLTDVEERKETAHAALVALDLRRFNVSRQTLERMLGELMRRRALLGATFFVNCSRHIATRLTTVKAIDTLADRRALVPLFTPTLRPHFLGATADEHALLTRLFASENLAVEPLREIARKNRELFRWSGDHLVGPRLVITLVEQATRNAIGDWLRRRLETSGHWNRGRFVLPFSEKTTPLYVEPHQIFSHSEVAAAMCDHIALLLRRRFARKDRIATANLSIITATRIGREFAARMPAAYPKNTFVFFDHYRLRPEKPRLAKKLIGRAAVIVVDVISTGTQVEDLIRACTEGDTKVIGIISIVDFSEGNGDATRTFSQYGAGIDHVTFVRDPQVLSEPQPGDARIDRETLSIRPTRDLPSDLNEPAAEFSLEESLDYLDAAGAIVGGHFELSSRHFDVVVDVNRLTDERSPVSRDILRECERILLMNPDGVPTAILLYPDASNTHLVQARLEKRPAIHVRLQQDRLRILEARRATRARGRGFWLNEREIEDVREWAMARYPRGFRVAVMDEAASSGETVLALIELARKFMPPRKKGEVATFVVINRMTHQQTRHHREIEKFVWAKSSFASLIHFNIRGYSSDNCPICRERRELRQDLRVAKSTWFREAIRDRLTRMDIHTTLEPDHADGRWRNRVENVIFPWERWSREQVMRTVGSCIVSARSAMNSGVLIKDVITAIDSLDLVHDPAQDKRGLTPVDWDVLWHEVLREIVRRSDLLQAQQMEKKIVELLLRNARDHSASADRRVGSIELLRYLRREATRDYLRDTVTAGVARILDRGMDAELTLFVRRVLEYRHAPIARLFERRKIVEQVLSEAEDVEAKRDARREAIRRLREEFTETLTDPSSELVNTIRRIEESLSTTRRPSHKLVETLGRYVADQDFRPNAAVDANADNLVLTTFLGRKLVEVLGKDERLRDQELIDAKDDAYANAVRLRQILQDTSSSRNHALLRSEVSDAVDDLREYLLKLEPEVKNQLVDLGDRVTHYIGETEQRLKEQGVRVTLTADIDPEVGWIVVDRGLFEPLIYDLIQNIGIHAVNEENVCRALIRVQRAEDNHLDYAVMTIQCLTRRTPYHGANDTSSVETKLRKMKPYGVERTVDPDSIGDPSRPWLERWRFWRL